MRGRRLALLGLLSLLTACSGGGPGRVVVIGLDGMDPQTVDLLMAEGKMPNFARLRQEGAYGRLLSSKPILSPIIWTTIATGKPPEQHGIGHFTAVNEKTGEQLPVTSQMRKVKAIWNIESDAGRKVAVVGWWATWPAERVNGAIVSDHTCYHFLFPEGQAGGGPRLGNTHPPELEAALAPLITRPGDLTMTDTAGFIQVTPEEFARPFDFNDDLGHFKWALATAQSYRRIGLKLLADEHPDLLMVYVEGTDSTAHLFGHLFRAQGLGGELAAQQQRFGGTVEAMYRYADGLVGDYMKAIDASTTLVILSDHGFELGALQDDPSKTRDMRRVSERYHRIEGILYLWGNRVRARTRLEQARLVDVAPTLLALGGLPRAEDMTGRVLTEALDLGPLPTAVASYEKPGERVAGAPVTDAGVDPAIMERLKSLGYVDTDSPKGDRNLAAVQFQGGHYEEAAKLYEKLVAANPDDGDLHASLAGALGALGRYDEALTHIETSIRLAPLNPEGYHNRAVIHERQGNRDAAIADYRMALRYSPQYEPARESLQRLGATAAPNAPSSDAERLAAAMAERASQAARRGDYQEAMKTLDEAARIAPRYALVYQYRANVAYLMGDRAAAIAALKQGLALEPDNALFQANLKRLEQPPAAEAKP
jgi:tetratricopeptide (TPR) repeat protein